jgi:programmed cell death 6-interacting protein
LERAVRDNDLVYVCPIPSATQLAPVVGAGMVKIVIGSEISVGVAILTIPAPTTGASCVADGIGQT